MSFPFNLINKHLKEAINRSINNGSCYPCKVPGWELQCNRPAPERAPSARSQASPDEDGRPSHQAPWAECTDDHARTAWWSGSPTERSEPAPGW